jgi:carbon storage regulator
MRRRAGECFLIGNDIEIQILEISQSRVRIGVRAPASIPIVRKEVILTRDENRTAASGVSSAGITWISEHLRSVAIFPPNCSMDGDDGQNSEKNSRSERSKPDK